MGGAAIAITTTSTPNLYCYTAPEADTMAAHVAGQPYASTYTAEINAYSSLHPLAATNSGEPSPPMPDLQVL
jgi:hypothetical protein